MTLKGKKMRNESGESLLIVFRSVVGLIEKFEKSSLLWAWCSLQKARKCFIISAGKESRKKHLKNKNGKEVLIANIIIILKNNDNANCYIIANFRSHYFFSFFLFVMYIHTRCLVTVAGDQLTANCLKSSAFSLVFS